MRFVFFTLVSNSANNTCTSSSIDKVMPRPPSKHGLEKKFKAWRRGKSKTSSTSSSLKQQLRGHERLLAKISEDESERRQALIQKIQETKAEIAGKESLVKERQNATKSHGIRFLERQRLVRMEKAARNTPNEEKELFKIALDQAYVAHFPHDIKYLPLFKKGNVRAVDRGKALFRRAVTRNRIFKELDSEKRVNWISEDQYKRLPNRWTIQSEQEIFGGSQEDVEKEDVFADADDRFALTKEHEQLLEAAQKIEHTLDHSDGGEHVGNSGDDSDNVSEGTDSESNDNDNALKSGIKGAAPHHDVAQEKGTDSDDGDSSDDSSTSDDSSSSDDDSLEDLDRSNVKQTLGKRKAEATVALEEDVDDFLMPATDENVFEKAKSEKASEVVNSGDKSKGWTTQRQRPGQFKPKKQRR